jgi:hypothetical protein
MHGTVPTATTPYHRPVLTIGSLAAIGAVLGAAWANYFYGWNFPAATVGLGIPLLGVAYLACLNFSTDWTPIFPGRQFEGRLWVAAGMMFLGLGVLSGIAVAASTRLGAVLTGAAWSRPRTRSGGWPRRARRAIPSTDCTSRRWR